MTDIDPKPGDYNDWFKAVFSGFYDWRRTLVGDQKENEVEESISLQDRAIAAVDAAIEDAFERGAEAAEEDQDSDAYDRGYADGAAGHLVQYNQGYAAGYRFATTEDDTEAGSQGSYNRGYEDGVEATRQEAAPNASAFNLAAAEGRGYERGKEVGVKEERERYAAARASISNSSAELAELQEGVYKAYDLVCALHWEAKAGSKAEASLIKVLDVFEDDSGLNKALAALYRAANA